MEGNELGMYSILKYNLVRNQGCILESQKEAIDQMVIFLPKLPKDGT